MENKIFISQSGEKARKYAEVLKRWFEDVFDSQVSVFVSSTNIRAGSNWLANLKKELKDTSIGFICLTKHSLKSEWVMFEAGALSINRGDEVVCPLLIDIAHEQVPDPLNKFQCTRLHDPASFYKFLRDINAVLDTSARKSEKDLKTLFENHWWRNLQEEFDSIHDSERENDEKARKIKLDGGLDLDKYGITPSEVAEDYGIISPIPGDRFHAIRYDLIKSAKKTLFLAGSSLCEAFDPGNETTDISRVIEDNIAALKGEQYELTIMLSEPRNFATRWQDNLIYLSRGETPLSRIERTLQVLLGMVKKYGDKLSLSIYFVPLLQVDHIVAVGDFMIIRNTMLWTYKGEYKGTRFLCKDVEDKSSLYKSYRRYIDQIMQQSITIESKNYLKNERNDSLFTDADMFHETWRKAFFSVNGYSDNIKIYKLYRDQLLSALHSTWDYKYRSPGQDLHVSEESDLFKANYGDIIRSRDDLYDYRNLIGERTQEALLEYLKSTESMLDSLVKHYDKDGGFAHIYPSFDLGVPNNVQRLAGGFATGMLAIWRCGTPIVPVDTTVNACASSVYKISNRQDTILDKAFNLEMFNHVFASGQKHGYLNSFDSGNHFISLCMNGDGDYFLVMHASAKEFKYTRLGLYPHKRSWYQDDIRTFYNKDKSRYLRYLKDDSAKEFIRVAKYLPLFNEDVHDWYAAAIAEEIGSTLEKICIKHHYYMPTSYSVAMGAFLEEPGQVVPVFSEPGKDIHLFKISSEQPWSLLIAGQKKCLIPHGWGQTVVGDLDVSLKGKSELLVNRVSHEIREKESINKSHVGVRIRSFDKSNNGFSEFYSRGKSYFSGEVVETLSQVASYQNGKINYYK